MRAVQEPVNKIISSSVDMFTQLIFLPHICPIYKQNRKFGRTRTVSLHTYVVTLQQRMYPSTHAKRDIIILKCQLPCYVTTDMWYVALTLQ